MKKWLLTLSAVFLAFTLVTACGTNNDDNMGPGNDEAPLNQNDNDNQNDLDRDQDNDNNLPDLDTEDDNPLDDNETDPNNNDDMDRNNDRNNENR